MQGRKWQEGPVAEELYLDADVAVGGGYGASKYVAERVSVSSSESSRAQMIKRRIPDREM